MLGQVIKVLTTKNCLQLGLRHTNKIWPSESPEAGRFIEVLIPTISSSIEQILATHSLN